MQAKKRDLSFVPEHLRCFVADQNMEVYTPIDHANWRYIMRVNRAFFSDHAHKKYLDGLRETGISIDEIPSVEAMDRCLSRYGWRAIPVSGFIPPTAFMEFQSLGILPIACDMRVPEHVAYTPAPDIVHEAAGHAPILVDPDYTRYLKAYGQVAVKAIYGHHDEAVYQAIRHLSIVKEDLDSTPEIISEAEQRLNRVTAEASQEPPSEAALLARMFWWSVEYGLIGEGEDARLFGAGLLSSIGESHACWSPQVKKIPFSLRCLDYSYDITKPQPQLFVTPTFEHLTRVLAEFEATMAFKRGGIEGLTKAKVAATVSSVELSSGLQCSGVVADWIEQGGKPVWFGLQGPAQVSYRGRELPNHGPARHPSGYSSPVGDVSLATAKSGVIKYPSGIELKGKYMSSVERDGKLISVTYQDCSVRIGDRTLFAPEWGEFDLAVGAAMPSVFGGAADRSAYALGTGGFKQLPREHRGNHRPGTEALEGLYRQIRDARESGRGELAGLVAQVGEFSDDWLARLEIRELALKRGDQGIARGMERELGVIKGRAPGKAGLIEAGMGLG